MLAIKVYVKHSAGSGKWGYKETILTDTAAMRLEEFKPRGTAFNAVSGGQAIQKFAEDKDKCMLVCGDIEVEVYYPYEDMKRIWLQALAMSRDDPVLLDLSVQTDIQYKFGKKKVPAPEIQSMYSKQIVKEPQWVVPRPRHTKPRHKP